MNKEDYFKYYIQGSDHYLIPKDVFDELFYEMESWKEDTQKYKEVIDKAREELKKGLRELDTRRREEVYIEQYIEEALNMLKEVE